MTYGLKIYGADGQVQVDDVSPTLVFLAKGSITLDHELTELGVAPGFDRAFVSSTGATANASGGILCAFRARDDNAPVGIWAGGVGDTAFVGFGPFGPPVVDWWMFGRAPPVAAGQYGLVVRDAAGRITWSAAHRPMRIVAAKNDVTVTNNTITGPAVGDYALAVGRPMGGVRSGSETSSGGMFAWLESRAMWGAGGATGFGAATCAPVRRLESPSYPTGWREDDIRASLLLVDVADL